MADLESKIKPVNAYDFIIENEPDFNPNLASNKPTVFDRINYFASRLISNPIVSAVYRAFI